MLCKLSKDKNHYQHENIALILEWKHSPKLINCTYELAIAKFDYMKEDEFFNIARKCTYALGYTNTPKAKEKLELLAKNENELIREYAIKQLNRHDFTDKDVEEQD
ncbi:HEAT repeat domain-containing protein [Fusobacterium animalis]|nr:HEAT repeat domain-containing protein [Fusobacterium animalis]